MITNEELPLCTSCGHNHEQGIKCSICGHVGKSQIFLKMRTRSNERRSIRIEHFGQYGLPIDDIMMDLILEIRNTSSVNQTTQSSWNDIDRRSSHAVCNIGDCPVGTIRYRIVTVDESNSTFAIIFDYLYIHPHYRQRKLSFTILFRLLTQFVQSMPFIQQIVFTIPVNSPIEERVAQTGFQRLVSTPICNYDSSNEALYVYTLENNQKLYDLLAFLQLKSENR